MINLNMPRPQQREQSLEEKLMQLLSGSLPALGTALGAGFGGPVGGAAGGALGGLAGAGMNAFMPRQPMQMPEQQPIAFGGPRSHGGMIDMSQMPYMPQNSNMEQFGSALGSGIGNVGMQALMSLLSPQEPSAYQSLMGKMDNTLQEKLARILAFKSMIGR
jgi:hypothetical protein